MSDPLALRHAEGEADIGACFAVMRQLRPHLKDAAEMTGRVLRQQAGGYRLLAAWRGEAVVGLAGYRMQENLIHGKLLYVDDLVVSEAERRGGLGARLLDAAAAEARAHGCRVLSLDTGLDNSLGQRFYFRWGLLATALHFTRRLT